MTIPFNDWVEHFRNPHELEDSILRYKEFRLIAERLCNLPHLPVIIETGCLRRSGAWRQEGNSTAIWDWFCGYGAEAYSVDINKLHILVAKHDAPRVKITCSDSIAYLINEPAVERCDLLFLDSYDYFPGVEGLSMLHHAGELAACYERLPSGCLIAIDDCIDNYTGPQHETAGKGGKHKICEYFFDKMGIKPMVKGYITGWVKP